MLANNSDYNQRVQQGKRIEGKIINALKQMGYRIDSASAYEDMNEKIDGWWIDKKDNRYPFQIKYRETGDDIIFEIIQDVAKQNMGRDMKSKAVLYIVADTFGRTRMFLTKPIKEKAEEVLEKIKRDQQKNPYQLDFRGDKWQAKFQYDRGQGQKKLVAYFDPDLFQALGTWRLDLHS